MTTTPTPGTVQELVQNTRAYGLRTYTRITAHPDEVLQIPSREPGRAIRVHAYNTLRRQDPGPAPVLINFHGSGFVVPLHGTDDEYAQAIVQRAPGYIVLDASYRLAPENPWPAAVHDAEDVVRWVLAQPERFLATHVAISGFSAGASLSLIMSGAVFPANTFRHVVAVYPATDLDEPAPDKKTPNPARDSLPAELMEVFLACYVPNREDRRNPLVSASFIPVERMPERLLLATGACDALCLEAEAFAHRIQSGTTKHVEMVRYEECEHAFDKTYQPGSVQERAKDELNARVAAFLMQ